MTYPDTRDSEEDEGEVRSDEEDSEGSFSSEGFTTDGEAESDEDDGASRDGDVPPTDETPWERGLRLARERAKKAKILRQTDVDLEEKRLKMPVIAPDPTEDQVLNGSLTLGGSGDLGFVGLDDLFWSQYYKLAIIGTTSLTGKHSLPCDLIPPSVASMAKWRRRHDHGSRSNSSASRSSRSASGSSSRASSVYTACSRASSLSSLAGSILDAVPDLLKAAVDGDDDSERESVASELPNSRGRRGRKRGSSAASSNSSRGNRQSQSNQRLQHQRRRQTSGGPVTSSSSSSRSQSQRNSASSHRSRSSSYSRRCRDRGGARGRRQVSPMKRRGSSWRGGKGAQMSFGGTSTRQQQQPSAPPNPPSISGYHHQQRGFAADRPRRDSFDGERNGSGRGTDFGGPTAASTTNHWQNLSNRSPDRPPMMPGERPVKRPWVADPSLKSRVNQQQAPRRDYSPRRAPPAHQQVAAAANHSPISRSPSPPSPPTAPTSQTKPIPWGRREGEQQQQVEEGTANTRTFITSWSPDRNSGRRRGDRRPEGGWASSPPPPPARKRPAPSRRKSRSPFADIEFGKQTSATTSKRDRRDPLEPLSPTSTTNPDTSAAIISTQTLPFEQTVPLLAGAVNPTAPPSATAPLPSASSRPGVKLKIAPRLKVAPVLPGSALVVEGGGRSRHRRGSLAHSNSSISDKSDGDGERSAAASRTAKRPRRPHQQHQQMHGYTAVSPGGFESPPVADQHLKPPLSPGSRPPPTFQNSSSAPRNRDRYDASETYERRGGGHFRGGRGGGGDYRDTGDRFSRGFRDNRRQFASGSGEYDKRTGRNYNDRRPSFDRGRFDRARGGGGGRDYMDRRPPRDGRPQQPPPYNSSRDDRAPTLAAPSRYPPYASRRRSGSREDRSRRPAGGTSNPRRHGNPARSRSPFEGRGGTSGDGGARSGGGGDRRSEAERRLDELRQRLNVVDDAIAELGGGGGSKRPVASAELR